MKILSQWSHSVLRQRLRNEMRSSLSGRCRWRNNPVQDRDYKRWTRWVGVTSLSPSHWTRKRLEILHRWNWIKTLNFLFLMLILASEWTLNISFLNTRTDIFTVIINGAINLMTGSGDLLHQPAPATCGKANHVQAVQINGGSYELLGRLEEKLVPR